MEYLTAPQVKQRYHISEMSLYRWIRDDRMAFPKPLTINRRRLFKREEIEAWERDRAKVAA